MPLLTMKSVPRDDCLLEAAKCYPNMDATACAVVLDLLRTGDEVFRVVDDHFAAHGLSEGRFTVLMLLNRNRLMQGGGALKGTTPAELADFAGVTRATITGLVDTLEKDGLVIRKPDAQDRRMMNVEMTEKGITLLESMVPEHFRRVASIIGQLTAEERGVLQGLLAKIRTRAVDLGQRCG